MPYTNTYDNLYTLFTDSQWSPISIRMNNGDTYTITPVNTLSDIDEDSIEYFSIEGAQHYFERDTLSDVAEWADDYSDYIARYTMEEKNLSSFWVRNIYQHSQNNAAWHLYSDWFLVLYGRRPDKNEAPKNIAFVSSFLE